MNVRKFDVKYVNIVLVNTRLNIQVEYIKRNKINFIGQHKLL